MAIKTAKNLLSSRDSYNRYFGNFRGVDFSNDHTNVDDSRFAYAVNMYRDYQSGQGVAIETIPGFRVLKHYSEPIYGIHEYSYKDAENQLQKVMEDLLCLRLRLME